MRQRTFDTAEFGQRLRRQRKREGYASQKDLATAAGVSVQVISAYENGDRVPSGDIIAALARALKCTTDYLFLMDDAPSREPGDVCRYLGISEEAVEALVEFNKKGFDLSALMVRLFRTKGIIDELRACTSAQTLMKD